MSLYGIAGCPLLRGFGYIEVYGNSELSVISQVSTAEGYPLSGVPLYIKIWRQSRLRGDILLIVIHTPNYVVTRLHSGSG